MNLWQIDLFLPITIPSGCFRKNPGHDQNILPDLPSEVIPEFLGRFVLFEDEEVNLFDPLFSQGIDRGRNVACSDSSSTPDQIDGQVVDIASTAVVPRQNGSDDSAVGLGDEAHVRVSVEVAADACFVVDFFSQSDPFATFPEIKICE